MAATLTSLRIRNLALVEDLEWRLGRGFIAVTGETGSGKSIILGALKLILGELAPRFGQVRVLGGAPPEARRRIGYVPQSLPFDPGFPVSVRDVVLMGRVDCHRAGPYCAADRRAAGAAAMIPVRPTPGLS